MTPRIKARAPPRMMLKSNMYALRVILCFSAIAENRWMGEEVGTVASNTARHNNKISIKIKGIFINQKKKTACYGINNERFENFPRWSLVHLFY